MRALSTSAQATGPVSVEDFLSETVVRALFAFTTSSFFAILAVLSDLADVYTGSNAFFRVRGARVESRISRGISRVLSRGVAATRPPRSPRRHARKSPTPRRRRDAATPLRPKELRFTP